MTGLEIVIITVSRVGPHPLRMTAHSNWYVPGVRPVTVVTESAGLVIVTGGVDAGTWLQVPVPGSGLFPWSVTMVVPDDWHWFGPAFACTGPGSKVVWMLTASEVEPQALDIVQVNTYRVFKARLLTVAPGFDGSEKAGPEGTTVQFPTSFKAGLFPCIMIGEP